MIGGAIALYASMLEATVKKGGAHERRCAARERYAGGVFTARMNGARRLFIARADVRAAMRGVSYYASGVFSFAACSRR